MKVKKIKNKTGKKPRISPNKMKEIISKIGINKINFKFIIKKL
jgi:hypothetical protein